MLFFINEIRKLGYESYSSYLNSEHWKNKRAEYEQSTLPKECLICGDANYQLHHRSYVRLGNEFILDLLPLCKQCHWRVHDFMDKNPNYHVCNTDAVIGKVFGWDRSYVKEKLKPFSINEALGWLPKDQFEVEELQNRLGIPITKPIRPPPRRKSKKKRACRGHEAQINNEIEQILSSYKRKQAKKRWFKKQREQQG